MTRQVARGHQSLCQASTARARYKRTERGSAVDHEQKKVVKIITIVLRLDSGTVGIDKHDTVDSFIDTVAAQRSGSDLDMRVAKDLPKETKPATVKKKKARQLVNWVASDA